ncbi:hypothetical protein LTR72_001454 [Exophiala xenobiotica]|nr:hypothetical protein LTR72_001454 [Exophiala xenobiotica]KAK5295886.1 hypothetical protein LTR14_003516 [Exophiala xenobiotica]KAK5492300.1 hypothetical protein LTR55_003654 [Exophiala xenobiotica]
MSNKDPDAEVEVDVFQSIPWCQSLLQDPDYEIEPTASRIYKHNTREDALLAETLKTDDTIKGWVSLYRRPTQSQPLKDEVRTLLSLSPGLNGYPRVCHGGIVATILDEVLSILVSVCRRAQGQHGDNVTAYLNVTYVKPVPTPGVLLVKGKIHKIERRKNFADGEIVNEQGVVLAKAEGLFVTNASKKLDSARLPGAQAVRTTHGTFELASGVGPLPIVVLRLGCEHSVQLAFPGNNQLSQLR